MRKTMFFCLACTSCMAASSADTYTEKNEFATSFVNAYDFFLSGRDHREYHPFILHKAQHVLAQLEQELERAHFALNGRVVVCGYQEDGIPSYFFTDEHNTINDEYRARTTTGWSQPAGTPIGLLVGYLFKDVTEYTNPTTHTHVKHIGADHIELLHTTCKMLLQHAFGHAFDVARLLQRSTQRAVRKGDVKMALACAYTLLKTAYKRACADGRDTLLATQDILFIIYHTRHILDSNVLPTTLFLGPDITYPISKSAHQTEQATTAAQEFANYFIQYVSQPHEKRTAYLFCSLMDGVGKSTLFGNIVNTLTHGQDIAAYQTFDNASSQSAQFLELSPTTILVDLPACMSHIVGKPDGAVYLAPDLLTHDIISLETAEQIRSHIRTHHAELTSDTQQRWVPVCIEGHECIFDRLDCTAFKVLVPLEKAPSHGLKIADHEHMRFDKPYLIPQRPIDFIHGLIEQLRAHDVEQIVFVDFVSMYPRSSRENIRVNFLLQLIQDIAGPSFSLEHSIYRGAAHAQELYLLTQNYRNDLEQSFFYEVLTRLALHTLAEENRHNQVMRIQGDQLKKYVKEAMAAMPLAEKERIMALVRKKIDAETRTADALFSHDTFFESYVRIRLDKIFELSHFLCRFLSKRLMHPLMSKLWQSLDANIQYASFTTQTGEGQAILTNGSAVEVVASWPSANRDAYTLQEPLQKLRASWYCSLAQLLLCPGSTESIPAMPYALAMDEDGQRFYVIRPLSSASTEKPCVRVPTWMHSNQSTLWRCVEQHPLYCDMNAYMEQFNHFGCRDNCSIAREPAGAKPCLQDLVFDQLIKKKACATKFIASSEFANIFDQHKAWKHVHTNGKHEYATKNKTGKEQQKPPREAVRECLLALATLDLALKDMSSQIMTRQTNRTDFIATLMLLEHLTLPRLFGLVYETPLFEDYAALEPVVRGIL